MSKTLGKCRIEIYGNCNRIHVRNVDALVLQHFSTTKIEKNIDIS